MFSTTSVSIAVDASPSLTISLAVYIEFLDEFGDLPLLQMDVGGIHNVGFGLAAYTGNFVMNITEFQKGTILFHNFDLLFYGSISKCRHQV
jgi:hypothetical protein